MKKIKDMGLDERKEICELLANWLEPYTGEVVVKVMAKREEIINNEFTMMLLTELKAREDKERTEFLHSIGSLFSVYDNYKEYDPHNHPLEHAKSYRDVLYDLYIR